MTQRNLRAMAGLLGAIAVLGACDDSTSQKTGTLALRLTDAPFPYDSVQSVDMFVVRIDAKVADTDSAEAADASGASLARGGWTTIAEPNQSFDLLTLQNGVTADLGMAQLPVGSYRGFRLVLDTELSSVTLKDGTVLTGSSVPGVKFPSAAQTGIKINLTAPARIDSDTTHMLIDFDVEQSFVARGDSISANGLLFKPVIRATVQQ
ncbi:MAG TPA: DUF4382 domain-containing protein [Gemmatimonadaceae bacterium]|nr:DUF4382 domain-containing protein [Gemmatimonadaceae bacterium]